MKDPCPCGLGEYTACCGRFHAGAEPETAEQCMRARYSAYARKDAAFLVRTSHPLMRAKIDAKGLRASFNAGWQRLEVLAVELGQAGDQTGTVHFKAHAAAGVMEEISRFSRVGGAWVYRDGRRP
jgi:SEC-C motif-containing protein